MIFSAIDFMKDFDHLLMRQMRCVKAAIKSQDLAMSQASILHSRNQEPSGTIPGRLILVVKLSHGRWKQCQ